MKRTKKVVLLLMTFCVTALLAMGCVKNTATETESETKQITEDTTILNAVMEALESNLIVLSDENGLSYQIDTEGLELKDDQGKSVKLKDLEVGQKVEVIYDGILMRNIPATIPGVISFTVLDQE